MHLRGGPIFSLEFANSASAEESPLQNGRGAIMTLRTHRTGGVAAAQGDCRGVYAGTCDQPKRWSSTETITSPTAPANARAIITFCAGRVSAPGPALIRHSSSA